MVSGYRSDRPDGLNGADFVVGMHDGNQPSVWTNCTSHIVRIDDTKTINPQKSNLGA
jgi:hypothetical protein